jgi:lactoylglutathione lyase
MTRLADLTRHYGIILGTERFDACVEFYRDVLGLPVWFEKPKLCCLRYGNGYLMVETGGVARDALKAQSENPTILRFNVPDVDAAADLLEKQGIPIDRQRFDWGVVGTFADPDGNACELKNANDGFFD